MPPTAAASPRILRAAQLLDKGRPDQARILLQEEIRKDPGNAALNQLMRHAMSRLGEFESALYYAQRAHAARPNDPDLVNILANSLSDAGKVDEAIAMFRRAIELAPNQPLNHAALSNIFSRQGKFVEALEAADKARAAAPHNSVAIRAAAIALGQLGRADEAAALLQEAMQANAGDAPMLSLLCNAMLFATTPSPQDIAAVHLAFGRTLAGQMATQAPPRVADPSPDRPLRVGLLGADFRGHATRHFIEPFIEHYDRSQITLSIYMHSPFHDEHSERMKSSPGVRWTNTLHLRPGALAARIRQDNIDVLVDTSSHTCLPALLAMHLRAAPVQATWLGYPCTSGVTAIDYRIVDSQTDPIGTENLNAEKLVRVDPVAMSYRAPEELPPIAPPPSMTAENNAITFGSFGDARKLNDRVIRLWARVLRETPGSRLIIKNATLVHEQNRDALRRRFELAGLAPTRVEMLSATPDTTTHLAMYSRVDIALDTFPYPGITTTCEALLMGVPVVSTSGPGSVQRAGISCMHAAGLDDLICADDEHYINAAAALVRDPVRRSELRQSLRTRLQGSELSDHKGWTDRFSGALRDMWKTYCAAKSN